MQELLGFEISNFQKIKLVSLELDKDKNVVEIYGKNKQGKTAVLLAIMAAFCGKSSIPKEMIREGQTKGHVKIETTDYFVTLAFNKENKNPISLKVESKVLNCTVTPPQKKLNEIIQDTSLQVLNFITADVKKQREILLSVVNIEINLDEIAVKKQAIFNKRTEIGRDLKKKQGELAGIALPDDWEALPEKEIILLELTKKYQAATEKINNNNSKKRQLVEAEKTLHVDDEKIAALNTQISNLKSQLQYAVDRKAEHKKDQERLKKEVSQLEYPDLAIIQWEMDEVENTNKSIRLVQKHKEVGVEVADLDKNYNAETKKLDDLEQTKQDALKKANFPIEGLSINESDIIYNNFPINQASTSEEIDIAFAILHAKNPEARFALLDGGESLDNDGMQHLVKKAHEYGIKVLMTRVAETSAEGTQAILIEDGEIK
jgi:hypothetical protein